MTGRSRRVIMGIAVAMAVWPSPAEATYPGANGDLSFYQSSDGSSHGLTLGGSTYLLDVPSGAGAVAWSSDGREMVYASPTGIVLRRPGTGFRLNLTSNPADSQPDISVGGELVAFVRAGSVYTVSTTDRTQRFVAEGTSPRWHPRDLRLAYV